jgi:hypothetical protein
MLSNPKSARQRERRNEQAMIKKLLSGNINPDEYDELLTMIFATRTGKTKFPKLANAVAIPQEASKVVANFEQMYGVMTSERNSHAARDLVVMLGNGVSYKFLEEAIGVPAPSARAYKSAAKRKGELPDLLTLRYANGDHPCVQSRVSCVCHMLSLVVLSFSSLCPLCQSVVLPLPSLALSLSSLCLSVLFVCQCSLFALYSSSASRHSCSLA